MPSRLSPAAQFWVLQIAVPASGLALLIAGHELGWPRLMSAGMFTLGVGAIASGVASALTRRITFARRGWGFELWVWEGVAALFIGAALLIVGLALATTALLYLGGMDLATMGAGLHARPGLALAPIGLALLTAGIGAFIGFQEEGEAGRGLPWNLFLGIPNRIAGVILSVLGVTALALGLFELVAPHAFDCWLAAIARGAPGRPAGCGRS